MRIIPVIDLKGGEVVRAVGGRRDDYRPIRSILCAGSALIDVARAFRFHFGLSELYLADLDAIAGRESAGAAVLLADGFSVWIDAGLRGLPQARVVDRLAGLVVGLETIAGPSALAEILHERRERVMFSLDLRNGKPLGDLRSWKHPSAWGVAEEAVALDVKRLLVLDLVHVGEGNGTGTEELCAALAASYPHVEILAGGGVHNRADLLRLRACGVSAALAASALHDGRLTRADLQGL